ncbi:MAG: TonB-system energizer ExbB [Gammaproteobacteria bacterium]|nr:MAG: TonB-system energizer ExbB [Gammaproteobacteria bacterium]
MHYIDLIKQYSDHAIFGILGLMSLIMLYKVLERAIFYARVKPQGYDNIHKLTIDLERGLTPIYTVGATAPYVGLLGTVVGILLTFYDMGQAGGNIEAGKIMTGLALALKATAAGILVAIPAVWFYNALTASVEAKKLAWQAYKAEQKQP